MHADVNVHLNGHRFVPSDSQDLNARLRAEVGLQGLQVESDVWELRSEGAPVLPPDVLVYILYTVLPLREIYVNLLSAVLWDFTKAAFSRHGRGDSTAIVTVCKVDEDSRILKLVRVQTSDPETIKDLIRQLGEEDEG
jgi:hypothetical protein